MAPGVRTLILIALASVSVATTGASAQSLFNLPFTLPGAAPPPNPQTYLPPDADPNYSTPGGFDEDVDMTRTTRKEVRDPTGEPAGTVTINTHERKLYLSLGDGRALQYGIGVGRQGFAWKGKAEIGRKAFWPGWTPPPEMLARQRDLPVHMDGGMAESARRPRALPVRGQEGHAVSHPWDQRAELDRQGRVVRMHSDARRRRDRPLRTGGQGHAGRRAVTARSALIRHRKHGAGRGDAAQRMGSEPDQRRVRFGGEGARDEHGAVERPA